MQPLEPKSVIFFLLFFVSSVAGLVCMQLGYSSIAAVLGLSSCIFFYWLCKVDEFMRQVWNDLSKVHKKKSH